jgi:hypothetical protein
MMFGAPAGLTRYRNAPGAIDESGAMVGVQPRRLAPPDGDGNAGPSTINLTDPNRYGTRPAIYGGGSVQPTMPPISDGGALPHQGATGGMFGAKHKINGWDIARAIAVGLLSAQAGRGNQGAAIALRGLQEQMLYRQKKNDADAETAGYVQALIARGVDPNDARIIAADPQEMSKHFGTRFDARTVDEGSSVYTPNLDGTANIFTAPKTFQNKADVVQMPGSSMTTPAYPLGSAPQPLGTPASIPGLRTEGEQYAASLGAAPGTPEWSSALQDYELKANGPTAFGFQNQLQSARLGNALSIARGHDATSATNNRRSVEASIRNNAATNTQSNTNNLRTTQTQAEIAAGHDSTHLRTSRRIRELPNEPVAVGPRGERLVVRNGAWVDSATGKPVQ